MDLTADMRKTIRIGAEEGVAANCNLTIGLLDDIDELRGLLREVVTVPITADKQTRWRIKVRNILDD